MVGNENSSVTYGVCDYEASTSCISEASSSKDSQASISSGNMSITASEIESLEIASMSSKHH
jgi:hypothetical protein